MLGKNAVHQQLISPNGLDDAAADIFPGCAAVFLVIASAVPQAVAPQLPACPQGHGVNHRARILPFSNLPSAHLGSPELLFLPQACFMASGESVGRHPRFPDSRLEGGKNRACRIVYSILFHFLSPCCHFLI